MNKVLAFRGLLAGPPLLMLLDLTSKYQDFGVLESISAPLIVGCALIPFLAATKRSSLPLPNNLYVGRINVLVSILLAADILSRVWISGGFSEFASQLLLPKGYKAWETGGAAVTSTLSLASYSGLIDPALCAVYLSVGAYGMRPGVIGIINVVTIAILTALDGSRLQFILAASTLLLFVPRTAGLLLGVPVIAGVLLAQSTLRGSDLSSNTDIYANLSSGLDADFADGSFLGDLTILRDCKLFEPAIDPGPVLYGMATYLIPRAIWPEKPKPQEETWRPYKESWMAVGLLPELALVVGLVPALLIFVILYGAVTLWLAGLFANPNPVRVATAFSIAISLFWMPRSLQSTIQLSPLVGFAYLVAWTTTRTFHFR